MRKGPRAVARTLWVVTAARRIHGQERQFDQAIAAFSVAYADQNEKDHENLERAVRKGKVKAVFEEE